MKFSILIFVLSFFSQQVFAVSFSRLQTSVPSLSFQNNKGTGTLQNLAFEMDTNLNLTAFAPPEPTPPLKIELIREGKDFKIIFGTISFNIKNASDSLLKLNTLQISKLAADLGPQSKHLFKVSDLYLNHESIGEMHVEDASVDCHHQEPNIRDFPQALSECLIKSNTTIEELEVPDMESFFHEALFAITPLANLEEELFQKIRDFELNIEKGDFNMNLKVKGMPLARLKAYGHIDANMAAKQATVRVDKIKYGLFGVTDIVMSQLKKKLPPENFRVEPPYIYVTWK